MNGAHYNHTAPCMLGEYPYSWLNGRGITLVVKIEMNVTHITISMLFQGDSHVILSQVDEWV